MIAHRTTMSIMQSAMSGIKRGKILFSIERIMVYRSRPILYIIKHRYKYNMNIIII